MIGTVYTPSHSRPVSAEKDGTATTSCAKGAIQAVRAVLGQAVKIAWCVQATTPGKVTIPVRQNALSMHRGMALLAYVILVLTSSVVYVWILVPSTLSLMVSAVSACKD